MKNQLKELSFSFDWNRVTDRFYADLLNLPNKLKYG
jgi:hypothetical protein